MLVKRGKGGLLFPTKSGLPKYNFLDIAKATCHIPTYRVRTSGEATSFRAEIATFFRGALRPTVLSEQRDVPGRSIRQGPSLGFFAEG
jgi:hypothetical protein